MPFFGGTPLGCTRCAAMPDSCPVHTGPRNCYVTLGTRMCPRSAGVQCAVWLAGSRAPSTAKVSVFALSPDRVRGCVRVCAETSSAPGHLRHGQRISDDGVVQRGAECRKPNPAKVRLGWPCVAVVRSKPQWRGASAGRGCTSSRHRRCKPSAAILTLCLLCSFLLQLDIAEFRHLLASCGTKLTEEEFCMLVDKYDVNEDGAISDTELLSQVSVGPLALCRGRGRAGGVGYRLQWRLSSCTALADRMCVAAYVCRCVCPGEQLEHLCSHEITHVTSRTWSQPSRVRYQSQYPPELPMHVPRPESPEQRRVRVSESPSSR